MDDEKKIITNDVGDSKGKSSDVQFRESVDKHVVTIQSQPGDMPSSFTTLDGAVVDTSNVSSGNAESNADNGSTDSSDS